MPVKNFDIDEIPKKYDYSKLNSWIAHPESLDVSKFLPKKNEISSDRSNVVVFFVHPTTYINRENWNQPNDDLVSNEILKKRIITNQVSIFSACCEVFAPRYRQATLSSFIALERNKRSAFKIAFEDVESSFKFFNKNLRKDRPFIIAGHSQGTMHALKLLKKIESKPEVFSKFIAAYLVGFSITKSDITPLKACEDNYSINCVVAWNSIEEDGFITFKREEDLICINPLSGESNENRVPNTANKGGFGFSNWIFEQNNKEWDSIKLEQDVAGAQCKDGNLHVIDLRSKNFPVRLFSLHAYDYGLFYMNTLESTKIKTNEYKKKFPIVIEK